MSRFWICSMIVGGLLVVGCEKTETAPAPAPAAPSADAAKDSMKDAAKDATAAAKDAGAAAKDTATAAKDSAAQAASATTAPAVPPPAEGAAPSAGDKTAEAQKLLDQAMSYIKDNKLELADKSLTQLEGMKASLPAGWGDKIDAARKAFTAAKASGNLLGK